MTPLKYRAPETLAKMAPLTSMGEALAAVRMIVEAELRDLTEKVKRIKPAAGLGMEDVAMEFLQWGSRRQAMEDVLEVVELTRLKAAGEPVPQPPRVPLRSPNVT